MPAKGALTAMIQAPVKGASEQAVDPGIAIDGVYRKFRGRGGATVEALRDVSFKVAAGQIVSIVGPSGCGKTTLLELICGLQRPDAGTVSSPPAAMMPQRDLLLPWLSALDNATLALRVRGVGRAQARAQARPWFERFGLAGFELTRPA